VTIKENKEFIDASSIVESLKKRDSDTSGKLALDIELHSSENSDGNAMVESHSSLTQNDLSANLLKINKSKLRALNTVIASSGGPKGFVKKILKRLISAALIILRGGLENERTTINNLLESNRILNQETARLNQEIKTIQEFQLKLLYLFGSEGSKIQVDSED
jgi:hypothetical protein